MSFQGLSVAKNCLKPETAPLTVLAIKRGLMCNFRTETVQKVISNELKPKTFNRVPYIISLAKTNEQRAKTNKQRAKTNE